VTPTAVSRWQSRDGRDLKLSDGQQAQPVGATGDGKWHNQGKRQCRLEAEGRVIDFHVPCES
jgi:hypothetical protein